VVADICLYREGLAEAFGRAPELKVVAAVAHPRDAVDVLDTEPVDIVLLGLGTVATVRAAETIASVHPQTPLVALAVDDRPEDVVPLAEAGICGYVPRAATLPHLVETVQCVARGELPCSASVAGSLVRRLAALAASARGFAAPQRLTSREQQVLNLIGEGLSNKEIGQRLCIQVPTVKNHVHHVLDKLQVRRRAEAVAVVRRGGWD
jgi:DNA-binding NarL/FixJ family response regulator